MAIAVLEFMLSKPTPDKTSPEGLLLAGVLKEIRRERRLTQQQVADNWDLTVDGYRPWERGERHLRTNQITSLAAALTISEADLMTRLRAQGLLPDEGDYQPSLRAQLAGLFGPDSADAVDSLVRELAEMPEADRQQFLATIRYQIAGYHVSHQRD